MTTWITRAQRISVREFRQEPEPVFRRIFKSLELRDAHRVEEIFQASFRTGLILECGTFRLLPEHFEALRKAARAVGDEFLYLTILYTGPPEAHSWRLPMLSYAAYLNAEEEIPRWEGFIALERVIYSPTGSWGVCSYDPYSIVCGSNEFLRVFMNVYKDWPRDLAEFVDSMREAQSLRGVNASWVQPLLDSLYGSDAPQFDVSKGAA